MKLSSIKNILETTKGVNFQLPDGSFVPEHFHVTEVGIVSKHFVDCGGTVRQEQKAAFQLWDAQDYEHRLKPGKLLHIITLSEQVLGIEDLDIEVEYQSNGTIGKYNIDFNGNDFVLLNTQTACLASDQCGVPKEQGLSNPKNTTASCTPGGGCC